MSYKFIVKNRGKGVINSDYPITDDDLWEIDAPPQEVSDQQETDPTVPQHVKEITEQDIDNWNNPSGATYPVFDNDTNGLVPAPNSSGSGQYSVSIINPTEGAEFSEGDTITIEASITETGKRFLREDGVWGSLEREPVEASIDNITEIPNRSYNDLQDLPDISGLTFARKTSEGVGYMLAETHQHIYVQLIREGEAYFGFNDTGDVDTQIVIVSNSIGTVRLSSSNTHDFIFPEGCTDTSISRGVLILKKLNDDGTGVTKWAVSGDLVKEYEVRQSPNGSLWKVSVDDSGNEVITAL